jgi:hypothetical protein
MHVWRVFANFTIERNSSGYKVPYVRTNVLPLLVVVTVRITDRQISFDSVIHESVEFQLDNPDMTRPQN